VPLRYSVGNASFSDGRSQLRLPRRRCLTSTHAPAWSPPSLPYIRLGAALLPGSLLSAATSTAVAPLSSADTTNAVSSALPTAMHTPIVLSGPLPHGAPALDPRPPWGLIRGGVSTAGSALLKAKCAVLPSADTYQGNLDRMDQIDLHAAVSGCFIQLAPRIIPSRSEV